MKQKYSELLKGRKVLIVEDDLVSTEFLKEILEDYDIELIITERAEESISICKNDKNIDIVLMDIRLPDKSGLEATKEIKKKRPDLPIIAQTAFALEGDKERLLEGGCDYYIAKPIKAKDLLSIIEKALQ